MKRTDIQRSRDIVTNMEGQPFEVKSKIISQLIRRVRKSTKD